MKPELLSVRSFEGWAAALGSVLVLGSLVLIWMARLSLTRDVYVSEMGAPGEPTAEMFEIALLLVVVGGTLIAYGSRDIRSRGKILLAITPAVSLWIASGFFLIASQVTCTPGCPVPYGDQFTWQDLTHIVCAVLAFAAACWAMLQVSFARDQRRMALISRVAGIAVALIASAGGILSLIGVATNFGSRLEFVATTIAIAWVAVYGLVNANRKIGQADVSPRGTAPRLLTGDDLEKAIR